MKQKKIILWLAGIIFALIIILLVFNLFLPRFINVESVRGKVIEYLSKTLGENIYIQKTELSFFPRPCIKIYHAQVSIQEKAEGKIELIKIYPKIFPLLVGEVQISKIHAEYPDFFIRIPEKKEKLSLIDIEKKLLKTIHILQENVPGIDISIKKGRMNLYQNEVKNLLFQNINARIGFPPWDLKYTITAHMDNSETIALSGRLDPENFKGKGSIYLKNFGIHEVTDFFLPDNINHIKDSIVNLRVSFQTNGIGSLQVDTEGSIPYLYLYRKNKKATIKISQTKTSLQINNEKALLSIDKIELDEPQMTLTGSLHFNKISPNIHLFLKGIGIDVDELRKTALSFASDVLIVRDVSEYIRGGKVPIITFYSKGRAFDDLGKTENMLIKGTMLEGNIFIPGPDLAFKSVNGDCVISNGILNGSQLYAKFNNAQLSKGIMKVGLKGEDAPFHLDTLAMVDLAELLPLLKHILNNDSLLKEFNLISNVNGNAQGRLILGETINSIEARFEVFNAKLYAQYKRIPFPIEVKEGRFIYDNSKVVTKNINFVLGKSSFSKFNSILQLREPYNFEIEAGNSSLNVEELFTWASSYKQLKDLFSNIKSLQGTTLVNLMSIRGPLLHPEKWGFRMVGGLQNLKINSSLFPGPLSITSKNFELTPQRISLTKALLNINDTSLMLSGFLKTNLKSIQKADISMNGTIESSILEWSKKFMNLPLELKIPHSLFLSDSHLIREETGVLSFQGSMKIKDGPDIAIDIYKTPKEVSIKNISIKDKTSDAKLSFYKYVKGINVTFNGMLSSKTADTLVAIPELSDGLIKGDLQVGIQIDKSLRIISNGKIYGEKIVIPWKTNAPIKIEKFSLDSNAKGIKLETNSLTWGNNSLSLKGSLNSNEEKTVIDMDISADRLDWNNVRKILEANQKEDKKRDEMWKQSIHVIAKLKSKDVIFDRFSVSPLQANISVIRGVVDATITKANICSIPISGKIKFFHNDIETKLKISSVNQLLEPVINCTGNKGLVTGRFDLQGEINTNSTKDTLAKSLNGKIVFKAKDGRIYRYGTIAKIFALLNVTEIFRGKLPDVAKEGFAYQSMSFKGQFKDGKLLIKEGIIDGSSMEIACEGNIDFIEKRVNLNLLVAPLKTVDFILRKIPLIRDITGHSLISIPVRVTGNLENPEVTYLPLSSVGSGLMGIMERTIKLPVKIIQPFIPNGEKINK